VKAVRVHEFGGPEVLTYEDVPDSRPGEGEALIEMQVIGVNYSDTHYRRGSYPNQASPLPLIPGHEGIGIVSELGPGASGVKVGDRVAFSGQHRRGTYRQLMNLPAEELVPVPPTIDTRLAVAVLNQGQTAHYLVHDARPVKRGEHVLIHAGAGGVGSNLVQMAKRLGAYVFTTVSTEEKADFVRDLGADSVIMYTEVDFAEEIKKRTDGRGVDVVYDAIGGDVMPKSLHCLAAKGHLVTYGQSAGPVPPIDWPLRQPRSYYISNHTGADYSRGPEGVARAQEIFRWVREGELKVHIHREYPLAEARQAHVDIQGRGTIGKLLLIP
jgi:NADPH2:quinone reductase